MKSTLADLFDPANDPQHDLASPLALAQLVDPNVVITPALQIINDALVDVEAGRCNRLIISMPPQEAKSWTITRFGVLWALRRNPDRRIGIVSYSDAIAETFSRLLRTDVELNNGTEELPDLGLRLEKDNRAVSRWNLARHRGGVIAVGIGAGLTGRPLDYLVIDDPVKDYRAADSELLSQQAWDWWQSVARPRLAPGAPVIVVLTRWHELDLAGRAIAKEAEDRQAGLSYFDEWRVINIPAQAEHRPELGEVDVLGREPGEYMLSARGRTQEQWEATKNATAPRIWSALYQGRPAPDAGDILQRHWFVREREPCWFRDPDTGSHTVSGAYTVLQSWDFAFRDKSTSDFVAGQVWAYRGAEAKLVDQVHKRLSFTESLAAMRNLRAKWPQTTAILVEAKANGDAVIDSLKLEIPGIIPINPKESKAARARAVAPFIEAGNVILPISEIALYRPDELIEEAAAFPNGRNDDQVDAMSQALQRIFLGGRSGAKEFLEGLAPMHDCGMPNRREDWLAHKPCSRCHQTLDLGESEPETAPPSEPEEPWSPWAGLGQPTAYAPNVKATLEIIEQAKRAGSFTSHESFRGWRR